MAKKFTPKVITANDLLEGDVIYFTKEQTWTRHLKDAYVFLEEAQANELLKIATSQASIIVGAYLANVIVNEDGTPKPAHFRETFRTKGPSNYFHGKQETA